MMLALCFAWFTLLAGAFLIWLYTPKGKKWLQELYTFSWNISHMEGFALVMCIGAVIGISLAIWSNTKSGQRWIDNL